MAYALITGASSGLGREFACLFAEHGYGLVLVARRKDRLEVLAEDLLASYGVVAHTVAADLATPEGLVALTDYTKREGIVVDVLVNNAGFGDCADFAKADVGKLDRMIELNIRALTDLTYYYLGDMLDWHRGKILNVASVAAFEAGPGMATYFASKAYVLSLTEALAEELRGTGVTATALCPGTTKTEFWDVAEAGPLSVARQAVIAAPADVAAYGYASLMAGKVVAGPGVTNKIMVTATRFLPRPVLRRVVRKLLAK